MNLPLVYPILDTASLARRGIGPVDAAEALLEGGAEILQFRHKDFWNRGTFAQSQQIARLCREARVLFIINDRADYAALLGRWPDGPAEPAVSRGLPGLHLGQDDLIPIDARRLIGTEPILGFSTHNVDQMRAAEDEPIDYLAFGPVFNTASKERHDPVVGIEELGAARALTTKPLVAIGGITRDNASICWSAGADSVAIIADLFPVSCTKQTLRDRMAEWRQLNRR